MRRSTEPCKRPAKARRYPALKLGRQLGLRGARDPATHLEARLCRRLGRKRSQTMCGSESPKAPRTLPEFQAPRRQDRRDRTATNRGADTPKNDAAVRRSRSESRPAFYGSTIVDRKPRIALPSRTSPTFAVGSSSRSTLCGTPVNGDASNRSDDASSSWARAKRNARADVDTVTQYERSPHVANRARIGMELA